MGSKDGLTDCDALYGAVVFKVRSSKISSMFSHFNSSVSMRDSAVSFLCSEKMNAVFKGTTSNGRLPKNYSTCCHALRYIL